MIDFDLILKYFSGKADPEEAMLAEEWAAASEDNRAFFQSLHQSWLEAGNEAYRIPNAQQEWEAFSREHAIAGAETAQVPQQLPPRRLWLTRVAAAAAVVVVAFAGFYLFNSKNQNEPTLIAIAKHKAEEVRLADGTLMTVEPEGELVYPAQFKKDSREVTLVGSGSFDVAHQSNRPFIVHLGDLHVKVLGTSFHVNRGRKEISVQVSKGRVAFYNKTDTVFIAAGETGKYIRSDKKFELISAIPTTGSFHFEATPLDQVAATLSAYFKKDIQLAHADLRNCKLSAGFDNQSLNDMLREITLTLNLTYKIEESSIYINGSACK
jgi:ferric-dicitrate binding protein FerR (iron transport regulator)